MGTSTWRAFFALVKGSGRRLAASVVVGGLIALTVVPLPVLVARVIDQAIPRGERVSLVLIGSAIVGLTVVSGLLSIVERKLALAVTRGATNQLRARLADKLLVLSREAHLDRGVANLHDVVVNDTDRIDHALTMLFRDMIPGAIMSAGLVSLLLVRSPFLTLITVGVGSLWVVINRVFYRRFETRFDAYHRSFRSFSDNMFGLLRSVELVKASAAERVEAARTRAELDGLQSASISRSMALCQHKAVHQAATSAVGTAILTAGGLAVIDGRMSVGSLLSFFAGFALLRGPLGSLSDGFPALIEGRVALARVHSLLDDAQVEPYHGTESVPRVEHLALDRVAFGYHDREVVRDFSLVLSRGRTTALVGPNGSGKSTIVNLVMGAYRPARGSLTVNGVAYDRLAMDELRRRIGIVSQDTIFLRESIAYNLAYGVDALDDETLAWALQMSGADAVVAGLPDGLATVLNDDARNLSGGQRQRLAIARALVRRPDLLILDEPTNHLDRRAIEELLENLRGWHDRPAVVIISHHGAVVGLADEVVYLGGWQPDPPVERRSPADRLAVGS